MASALSKCATTLWKVSLILHDFGDLVLCFDAVGFAALRALICRTSWQGTMRKYEIKSKRSYGLVGVVQGLTWQEA